MPGRTDLNYNVPGTARDLRRTAHGGRRQEDAAPRGELDPRVHIGPVALATPNSLSTGLYQDAVAAHRAFNEA